MSTMKQTGGAAFPELKALYKESMSRYSAVIEGGLTVRDYFAAKALPAILAQPDDGIAARNPDHKLGDGTFSQYWAKCAYEIADAMLAARGAA